MQPVTAADANLDGDTGEADRRPLRGWQRRALVKYLAGQARDRLPAE